MFVNSADRVLEVLYGSVSLDVNVEACLGSQSEPRLRHEWRRHRAAMSRVTIVNGQEFNAKFRTHIEENPAQPLELQINEVELFSVSGVQRKTISTMALNLNDAALIGMNQNQFCRIGSLGGNDGSSVQFFEVSELDFRNARFKQAIQQRKTMLCGSMFSGKGVELSQQILLVGDRTCQTTIPEIGFQSLVQFGIEAKPTAELRSGT